MTSQLGERHDVSALLEGRGRGPGGQPSGLRLPTGRCAVPVCGEQIDQTRLMCRHDWYHVPKWLRDQVWRSWRSGQEANSREHQQAVIQAIAAARLARLPNWRRQIARLGHHVPSLQISQIAQTHAWTPGWADRASDPPRR